MARFDLRYTEAELRAAIAASLTWSDALRRVGLRAAGGNHRTIQRYARLWGISTDHFDPNEVRRRCNRRPQRGPAELDSGKRFSVENSTCVSASTAGTRRPHINGVADDNRLENLQIVCPNCAATLDTHCGRNGANSGPQECVRCGASFYPRVAKQRYCSKECGNRSPGPRDPQPERRKVDRPPYDQLMAELAASNYSAVGRRYGVSDNAVRKWVRWYERQRLDEAA